MVHNVDCRTLMDGTNITMTTVKKHANVFRSCDNSLQNIIKQQKYWDPGAYLMLGSIKIPAATIEKRMEQAVEGEIHGRDDAEHSYASPRWKPKGLRNDALEHLKAPQIKTLKRECIFFQSI